MNNYKNEFLEELKKKIPNDCKVEYQKVKKNNGVELDGFVIRQGNSNIAPMFYVTKEQQEKFSPEDLAEQTIKRFYAELEKGIDFDIACLNDISWVRSHVMFEIVNRKKNASMNYASIPITEDLMIIFKLVLDANASITISNELLERLGKITAEELLEEARKNSVVMDRAIFRTIEDVLVDLVADDYRYKYPDLTEIQLRARIKEEIFGDINSVLYVLSTQRQSNAALLYPGVLDDIMQKLGEPIYILPSSTCEVLVLKESDALDIGIDNLSEIVKTINRDIVVESDATNFLSDEILRYDGQLSQLELDVPITEEIEI